jgi:hypothetical protein
MTVLEIINFVDQLKEHEDDMSQYDHDFLKSAEAKIEKYGLCSIFSPDQKAHIERMLKKYVVET